MTTKIPMYDDFSADYDRFVNWQGRLELEIPFIEQLLRQAGARQVLDAACGTGMHAIALAQRGFVLAGADLSAGMVRQAQANAHRAAVQVRFVEAGFGGLRQTFGTQFDAVLCLGNSLPHLLSRADLQAALEDFAACLEPGGLLLIQNRNFDAVLSSRSRWMEPQNHRDGEREWLFLRFYDFDPDGLISFHIITLLREGSAAWRQSVSSTRLNPQRQADLEALLGKCGFAEVQVFGDMTGTAFIPAASSNLVLAARWA